MSRSRRWLVALAALVFVGAAVLLVREWNRSRAPRPDAQVDDDVRADDAGDDAIELVGRSSATGERREGVLDAAPAATEPARPSVVIRGRLVTADGGRLRDPRAYLVPKGSPGFRDWRKVEARAEVEDDGSWSLEADPRGTWIAGLAAGYRPAFVDGDAWDGEEVEVELELGRRIEITVAVSTEDVPPTLGAYVCALGDAGYDYPGPGSEPDIATNVRLDRTDRAPVHVSMDGPIRVHLWAPDFVKEPEFVDLARGEHQAEFRVTLGGGVALTPRDAETGYPLVSDVKAAVFAPDEPIDEDRFFTLRDEEAYRLEGLLPGAHRIAVKAPGYETWRSDVVHLTRPGQFVELEVPLEPRRGAGRLLLEVVPPEGGSLEGALVSILVGRRSTEGRLQWISLTRRAQSENRRHVLLTPIDPGEIHLLAWTGSVAVGWLGAVRVSGSETDVARLDLVSGTVVRLSAGSGGSPGAFYSGEVSATVRRSDGTVLPLAVFLSRQPPSPGQRLNFFSNDEGRDEPLAASPTLSANAVLGPYPFSDLIVEGPRAELLPNSP